MNELNGSDKGSRVLVATMKMEWKNTRVNYDGKHSSCIQIQVNPLNVAFALALPLQHLKDIFLACTRVGCERPNAPPPVIYSLLHLLPL